MKRSYLLNNTFIFKPLVRNKLNLNQVMFKVSASMTKHEIKYILENLYNLKIKSINTILVQGKRKRSRYSLYRAPRFKKAIITLN